jgi:putative membrane protein
MPEETAQEQMTPNIQVRLALERTRVAYDRTMMAWIRTATSLITFGFGVYKFFQLELKVAGRGNQRIGVREFALLMVGAGVLAIILGTVDHWRNIRGIRKRDPTLPRSLAAVLAALIVGIGVLAMFAVIFKQ